MPKTLLLADDSVTIQKVVGLTFANEDVTLVTVDNGDDAIARAKSMRPDLVLADVVMPGRNGYEVCEAIKTDPSLRHVPVLLLSGTFEAFDDERARRAGADGHITKPFEAQALVETVHRLLAQSASAPPAPAAPAPVAAAAAGGADAGFDFFDDDLLGEGSQAAQPPAAASSLGATLTTTVQPEARESAAEIEESPYEKTAFELSEEAAIDEDETSDVEAATDALYEDDADLGSTVVAAMEEDEEPFDLGLQEGTPPAVATRVAGASDPFSDDARDPLAPLARTGQGMSPVRPPAGARTEEDVSAPDFGAMPGARAVEVRVGGPDPNAGSWRDLPDADLGMSIQEFEDSKRGTSSPRPEAGTGFGPSGLDLGASDRTPTAPSFEPVGERRFEPVGEQGLEPRFEPTAPTAVLAPREEPAIAPLAPPVASPEPLEAAFVDDEDEAGFEEAIPFGPLGGELAPKPAEATHAAKPVALPEPEPLAFAEPLSLAERSAASEPAPVAEVRSASEPVAAAPSASLPDLSPMMRQRIHDTLEKVAWEAFADLSDTIVRQVLARVEAVAWEVIPAMAETLVREEIRRMKGDVE